MTSLDFLNSLPLPAQIAAGVFGGWLLVETARLADRFIVSAHNGLVPPKTIAGIYAALVLIILATLLGYHKDDPDERFSMFSVAAMGFVGVLLVMRLHAHVVLPRLSRYSPAKASPSSETTPATDAAPTSIDDDWADIAHELKKENDHA